MLIVNKNRYSAVEYWYSMCINIYLPFWQLIYSICGMVFEWTVQIRLQWTGSGTMERKRSWYLLNPILDGFLHCKWTMHFLFLGQHPLCQTPLVSCLLPFLIQCFFLLPLIPHSFLRLHRNIKTGTEKFKKKEQRILLWQTLCSSLKVSVTPLINLDCVFIQMGETFLPHLQLYADVHGCFLWHVQYSNTEFWMKVYVWTPGWLLSLTVSGVTLASSCEE